MAGTLCTFKSDDREITWKVSNFANAEIIMLLPLRWYEKDEKNRCVEVEGVENLVKRIKQDSFKGYTSKKWCSRASFIVNCGSGENCGKCMGLCNDVYHICTPYKNKFICGIASHEQDLMTVDVSFNMKKTVYNPLAIAFVVFLFIIFVLLGFLYYA